MARVARTRNGGTWTEAEYWSRVRGALRKAFAHWQPANEALKIARRPYVGPNKRQKWEYQCAGCNRWFMGKEMHKDHITPCGSLRSLDDLAGFLDRLTPESPAAFQGVCGDCHKVKTASDREAAKNQR